LSRQNLLKSIKGILYAKSTATAEEPIANLILFYQDRQTLNGAMFKLDKRVNKPDPVMNDNVSGAKLWDKLVQFTGLSNE
jgi:hypothetical protein